MNEETLMADVVSKLTEIGIDVDDNLPKFIITLIVNQRSIEQIKNDLAIFLDSETNHFINWLKDYLVKFRNKTESSKKLEVISASEIEEDILDFEENVEEEDSKTSKDDSEKSKDFSSSFNSNDSFQKNKRKHEDEDEENNPSKKLNNNEDFDPSKSNNLITLSSNKHLNDIGIMRRKAIEEKNKFNEKQDDMDQTEYQDLRDKLNRNKELRSEEKTVEDENTSMDYKLDEKNEDDKKERCKFWPLCKNGTECIYFHPVNQCSQFPNCKFGEKCLYIHPICKFDTKCTKKDCPFTHLVKKVQSTQHLYMNIECKFYPNCFNMSCPYIHPKMCIYGANCKNLSCLFKHPEVSTNIAKPHQLKWNSKNQQTNNLNESSRPEDSTLNESTKTEEKIEDNLDKLNDLEVFKNQENQIKDENIKEDDSSIILPML